MSPLLGSLLKKEGEASPSPTIRVRRSGRISPIMGLQDLLREKREEILRIAARHGAFNVRVFGSVARGESGAESDIDFLIELERGRSLLDRAALVLDLEKLLGRRVDVANERGLKPRVREQILREAIRL